MQEPQKISNRANALKGKIALVTGASGGIGRAVALKLADLGADIAVNYLSRHTGAEETVALIKSLGRNALTFVADISLEEKVRKMVADVNERMGKVTILVNNAAPPVSFEEFENAPWDAFASHLNVQVRGAYHMMQAILPGMKKERYGKMVNILSAYILQNFPKKVTPYLVAKEALWGLTKAAAAEFASYGIRVNGVSPWVTDTAMADRVSPPRYKEMVAQRAPLGRITTPEDVANIVGFLASSESDHLTGVNIPIGIT